MKSLDNSPTNSADYRRSWKYWANIHGYFGTSGPFGTVQNRIQFLQANGLGMYVPYYQGITDQTPPDATAQTCWGTCKHSSRTTQANFFAWHRMYLYYFERVLRWAANDNSLRLPYWDYTDPTQVGLPAEFQNTTSVLYDPKRDPSLNTGSTTLDPNSTDIDSLLTQPDYFIYEGSIESGIHGYVHCTVGATCPVAHMGDVPVAANDPIFYSHHANIDRLWACWQNLHPSPAGGWQNDQFSFVDENATLQTQPVSGFLDSTALGYVYDNVKNCGRTAAPAPPSNLQVTAEIQAQGQARRAVSMVAATKSIAIDRPLISVDLDVPQNKIREFFALPEGVSTIELILRDITAQSPPGVLFNVYLVKKPEPKVRVLAGTISWFGDFGHHDQKGLEPKTLRFDVTKQLREVAADTAGVTVAIEATQGRVPKDPSKLEQARAFAAKAFRPEAKLQIGAIELQQVEPARLPDAH